MGRLSNRDFDHQFDQLTRTFEKAGSDTPPTRLAHDRVRVVLESAAARKKLQ